MLIVLALVLSIRMDWRDVTYFVRGAKVTLYPSAR